jgi:tripartite-type tricarboxylate transporter receptor subunit TctC
MVTFLRRRFLQFAAGAAALPAVTRVVWAQTYPTRPITIIVPSGAGGPTDLIARIITEHMRRFLGQAIIIENVTGANGNLGISRVARAKPDGYTLAFSVSSSTHVINGAIYTLTYDVVNDFAPIALVADNPLLILAKNAMPASDLKGLITWLKANPNAASLGQTGPGSPAHLAGILFQKQTEGRFQFANYRSVSQAMQDLVGGHIDLMFVAPNIALEHVRAGRIKAYAVTAKKRLAMAPDIPTVDEGGLPDFYPSVWYAFWAPKGTPRDVIGRLNAAVVDALADTAVRVRLAELGQGIFPREQQTPEALDAHQKAEIEKWWPIIKAANIKAD